MAHDLPADIPASTPGEIHHIDELPRSSDYQQGFRDGYMYGHEEGYEHGLRTPWPRLAVIAAISGAAMLVLTAVRYLFGH